MADGLPAEAVEAITLYRYGWHWTTSPGGAGNYATQPHEEAQFVRVIPGTVMVVAEDGRVTTTDALRDIAEYDVHDRHGYEDEWTTAEAFEAVQEIARAALSATDTEEEG